ncbi:hypothetical protein NLG97_g2779 [Lecanicillium saksenae]|uniref:Uncharacterized protein n=1 Tax=Lecanicillium saksenae TaxID=468837 RepID=A0ACC1R402_9HYPO|nr:hypothetical protein NLG97_g2779 [Lecanicillium saksenae]
MSSFFMPIMATMALSDASLSSDARNCFITLGTTCQETPYLSLSQLHFCADSLPPGLQGASRRPHMVSSNGSRTSPTGNGDPSAPTPLDPRTQPETSTSRDFLASRKKAGDAPIPLIDVHEIDPKLDGIFIKANAVRDTFTTSSVKSSPATSPPTDQSSSEQEGTLRRRTSSKAQTMQALAAGEMRRRTMHAGHTPNHSLSLFPTMTTLDGSMTAGQSEATTPTAVNKAPMDDEEEPETLPDPEHMEDAAEADKLPESPVEDVDETQMEPRLEPQDDVPLKGPLMVKNIPAQDEIFWAQVNQKLEGISNSEGGGAPDRHEGPAGSPGRQAQDERCCRGRGRGRRPRGEQAGGSRRSPQDAHNDQLWSAVWRGIDCPSSRCSKQDESVLTASNPHLRAATLATTHFHV